MSQPSSSRAVQTILCATDFSAASEQAFRVACSLAAEHAAKLIVVHVAGRAVPGLGVAESLVLHDDYLGAAEARLRALQGRAPHVPMQFRIEEGHPSTEIIKLARATRADRIVIGSRGAGAPIFPPSTSVEVSAFAPCAVVKVAAEPSARTDDSHLEHLSHEHPSNRRQPSNIL
jgi:nucleotide-binding universal stress UspA family protein